jgi:hypothetical protein
VSQKYLLVSQRCESEEYVSQPEMRVRKRHEIGSLRIQTVGEGTRSESGWGLDEMCGQRRP